MCFTVRFVGFNSDFLYSDNDPNKIGNVLIMQCATLVL